MLDKLIGKTLTSVTRTKYTTGRASGNDALEFTCDDGTVFVMTHLQDCCEGVSIEDINGDLNDLVGSPILMATETTSNEPQEGQNVNDYDTFTWTFYRISTFKGTVVIRWYGESNGYYSESVDFFDKAEGRW
jgi:hypothetical protein